LHYGASTHLRPDLVMSKAVDYFASLGLETVKRSPSTLTMENAKGQVAITLSLGTETEVDIVTQGFNQEVKSFLQRIG
jgi:hypothetical protein